VRRDLREVIADWLILLGAVALLVSLLLPWSHQFSRGFQAHFAPTGALRGIASDPTAWQVYSVVDVLLAVLAAALAAVALVGGRARRLVVLIAAGVALAFTVHARARPPTTGTVLYAAVTDHPRPGVGETVAIVSLGVAIAGLALSFTAD
jgi:hypothetical protein